LFISIIAFLAAASQAAMAQEWSEWEEIADTESYLVAPRGWEALRIRRQVSRTYGARHEVWGWESGLLQILSVKEAMRPIKKKDLVEVAKNWEPLGEIQLEVDASDIKRDKNKIGRFYYFESNRNNSDLHCFVFLQNLPANAPPPGYFFSPDAVGGNVGGFDCRDGNAISAIDHERIMLSHVKGLRRARR
ncbi:MAG: hypothetical protein ACE5Q3_09845, partial [Alphaproteobacteria bacterium]